MKNKLFLPAFLFIFFFIGANETVSASQTDFYGTWLCKIAESDMAVSIIITITKSNFIMEMSLYIGGSELSSEKFEMEIDSWMELNNSDTGSKADYPDGFTINMSAYGVPASISMDIFLSRDKRRITIPELNEDITQVLDFIKQ